MHVIVDYHVTSCISFIWKAASQRPLSDNFLIVCKTDNLLIPWRVFINTSFNFVKKKMVVRDRRRHSSSTALDSGAARLSCVPWRAPIVLLHRWSMMEQGLDPLGLPMDVPWSGHCVSAQSQRPRKGHNMRGLGNKL
jgi:hypothetical protein